MSTKDNEPQVKNLLSVPLERILSYASNFSGPWPHPLRVHGVVLRARSLVLEKLPQFLMLGLNFSVFQRSTGGSLSAAAEKWGAQN